MTIGFMGNVGNRDLYVDGQPIDQDCRRRGEEILRDYNQYQGRLSAPIIEAGLGYILRQHPQGLDWLALFVTDQDPATTRPEHYARDTVTMGKVLKHYLEERYPHSEKQAGILRGRDKGVFCHPIRGVNPIFFDEMHGYYEAKLAEEYFNPPDLERLYVSPVGGIPAANMALLLQAVARYGERCHALYVPEGSRTPTPMNITERILRDAKRRLAQEFIQNHHYAQAAGLMEGWLAALARAAAHRFNLDYQAAWQELQDNVLPHTRGAERRFVQGLCGELGQVAEGAALPFPGRALPAATAIRELYFTARIAYHSGRYMDFLHRVFSFLETALSCRVEAAFGIAVPSPLDSQEAFLKAVRANPYLVAFLCQQEYEGAPLRWEEGASRPVLAAMVRYLGEDRRGPDGAPLIGEDKKRDYDRLADLLQRLDRLAALRNDCVHPQRREGRLTFQGVTQEQILAKYRKAGGEEPLADMGEIVRLLGLDADDDPYRRVGDFIVERL